MDERSTTPPTAGYRGTLSGDGRPGPIEQRIGRRLLRLIDPESEEGARLLAAGEVELIGPDGENLGRVPCREAFLRLEERLESRLRERRGRVDADALLDGVTRVRAWSERISHP